MTWTHRDRVLAVLNHEEPDRIQREVPPENVVAMLDAAGAHRYGGARA